MNQVKYRSLREGFIKESFNFAKDLIEHQEHLGKLSETQLAGRIVAQKYPDQQRKFWPYLRRSRLGRFLTRKPAIYGPGGDWGRYIGAYKEPQSAMWNIT